MTRPNNAACFITFPRFSVCFVGSYAVVDRKGRANGTVPGRSGVRDKVLIMFALHRRRRGHAAGQHRADWQLQLFRIVSMVCRTSGARQLKRLQDVRLRRGGPCGRPVGRSLRQRGRHKARPYAMHFPFNFMKHMTSAAHAPALHHPVQPECVGDYFSLSYSRRTASSMIASARASQLCTPQ